MTQKVYAIRDSKGDMFHQPFHALTHGEAERHLDRMTKDDKSMLFHYPEDYDLYYLGEFNTKTGLYIPLDTPQHVLKAALLVQKFKGPTEDAEKLTRLNGAISQN